MWRRILRSRAGNIGERIGGDALTTSPYELKMKQDEACVVLCRKVHKKSEITMFKTMIDEEYRVHWLLDNLPVAVRNGDDISAWNSCLRDSSCLVSDELGFVTRGYPIGFISATPGAKKPQHFLFNHVRLYQFWFMFIGLFTISLRRFELSFATMKTPLISKAPELLVLKWFHSPLRWACQIWGSSFLTNVINFFLGSTSMTTIKRTLTRTWQFWTRAISSILLNSILKNSSLWNCQMRRLFTVMTWSGRNPTPGKCLLADAQWI